MKRISLFCVFVACNRTPPLTTDASTASAPPSVSASAAAPAVGFAETDFQGTFNGAKLVAVLEAKSTHDQQASVSGSLFYEAVGVDIPVSGSIAPDGAITLNELKGATSISTITLARAADGTLSGTWKTPDKSGPAKLSPVVHKAGDKLVVATRPLDEKSIALCGDGGGDTPKVPCWRKAKVPLVLGLSDRAFEKKLDDALLDRAKIAPPPNPEGIGVSIDFTISLADRGILSIVFVANFECSGAKKDCSVDAYVPLHKWGRTTSLTAAVESGIIAKSYKDFMDFSKVKPLVGPMVTSGYKTCVMSAPDDPIDGIEDAVLEDTGVSMERDQCANHTHTDVWEVLPYTKLSGALITGSPFASAWKK